MRNTVLLKIYLNSSYLSYGEIPAATFFNRLTATHENEV